MVLNEEQMAVVNATENYIVVNAAAGSGKAQPDYTLIPTPQGIKRMDELQVGDYVFNRFGQPEVISGIYPQGEKQIYEVELADGRVVECCEDHLWSYDNSHDNLTTHSIKEMLNFGFVKKDKRGHNSYKFRIPNLTVPVQFNTQPIDIDPYIMGCFIGDGCCLEGGLTISSNDEWLVNQIAELGNFNYRKNSEHNYSWTFYDKENNRIQTKQFFNNYNNELIQYCGDKRIPYNYIFNSVDVRLSLLQGLMDTDGYTGDGRHSPAFSTTSKNLALDVQYLARSLGFTTQLYVKDRTDKKSIEYKVSIFTSNQLAYTIFRLPRKRDKALSWMDNIQHTNHKFISIRDIRSTDRYANMRCIYVEDKEHLYLTNDFVATHNTTVLTEKIKKTLRDGAKPEEIVAITFTNNAAGELLERLGDRAQGMFVGTVHSYANYLLLSHGVDTHHYLEKEDFDSLFELVKQNPRCVKNVDYLFLDEAQDSTPQQYEFLLDMIKPQHWTLVGDIRQSIYGWSGGDVEQFMALAEVPGVAIYHLKNNYRCGSSILNYARSLIRTNGWRYEDDSIPMSGIQGAYCSVELDMNNLLNGILNKGSYGDWFILCRTNEEVDSTCNFLSAKNIPHTTFKKKDLTNAQLREKMSEDTIKVLTIHSSKGLEAKYVAVIGARYYDNEERCVSYVAATRAKELLVWTRKPVRRKAKTRDYTGMSTWD